MFCGFSLFLFYHQKIKNTNERNVKKIKGRESEEEEEDKNNDYYIKQRDEPPGTSKHLQKKAKKQAKKQAKVGFDKYFIFTNEALETWGKRSSFLLPPFRWRRRGQLRISPQSNTQQKRPILCTALL